MPKKQVIGDAELVRLLAAVFTLCLLDRRINETKIARLVESALRDARKTVSMLRPERRKAINLTLLGSVLHRWSRNPKYLDANAAPVPIKATGRAPSIEALFRAEKDHGYFKPGLGYLLSAGLVQKTRGGMYIPKNDVFLLHSLTPELVANLAVSINRLVSTLLQNTATQRRSALRLIERNAFVHDLPRAQLREFKLFSREQGAALVSTVNDWLENRRTTAKRNKNGGKQAVVTAGLHVFAFAD